MKHHLLRLLLSFIVLLVCVFECLSFQARLDSLMRRGQQQYAESRHLEAVQTFLAAGADTGKAPAQYALGLAYAGLNDFPNARKFLQLATGKDSARVLYRFQLAQVLVKSGATEDAEREYGLVTQIDSTYLAAFFQLGALLNGQQKDDKRQAEVFSRVVALNPNDYISWHFLSRAVAKQHLKDSSLLCLKRSLEINPNYFGSTEDMARMNFMSKNFEAAIPYYERAVVLQPKNARLHFELGECYRQESKTSRAIGSFQTAIALDTLNAMYVGQLGLTFFAIQNYDHSIEAYEKAIALEEDNPKYYTNLALVYQALDSTQLVVKSFHRAVHSLHPEKIADLYKKLGGFYFNKRLYKEAVSAFEKALQYDPSSKDASLYTGYAYESLRDQKSAIKYFERYLLLTHDDSTGNRQRDDMQRRVESMKRLLH
jgi:tetratricopeptide (TPR) repeat protein